MSRIARLITVVAILWGATAIAAPPSQTLSPAAYLPFVGLPLPVEPSPSASPSASTTVEPSPSTEPSASPSASTTVEPSPSTEPSPPPGPATPTLPPPDFTSCALVGNPARAPNYPVRITAINKVAETVTLQNVSGATVSLDGWRMCSITGGQQHPIGGSLAAGESRTFPGPAANIWNNSNADPGALWNPQGQLVSYWPD